ncbi:MAG TPA: ABC transporter substrate-binding protein [Micromonosporaceae bacterium]|nr:ABC transporter substrate-binding protein [Micromonosporaceae bacterium]
MDRRQALRLFAGLGAAAAVPSLAACGGSSLGGGDAKPVGSVKIGLLAPQTGIYKVVGLDMIRGFELYLKLNGNKLGGREVELFKADEGDTADSGKTGAEKLIKQDKVLALTGVVSSATIGAIKELVETSQIPLVGSNASPTTLQGVKYIWRTSYVNDEPGKALGKYLADNIDGKVFCLAANYQAGIDEIEGLKATFLPAGGVMANEPLYTPFPTLKNFGPHLNQIKSSDAKAVFCFYGGGMAVQFVKEYKQFQVGLPLYAPGFLTEGAVLKGQGDAATGIFTSMNYAADLDNAANRKFASEYQKQHEGEVPTTYAMASYDAAAVLDKAVLLAGEDLTPQTLNAALGRVGQIDSPRGTWQFNQNRTPQQKWYLREVKMDGAVLANTLVSELTTLG